ncbi:caspase family protein [Leptothoe sp. PORK10 BA2]|uniref:caspase family protein n=1 Tax=Leptothoe sp. PORK10 BA2 TaxID=3110254 RepID=UPI002B216BE6|nr:caspase family protein [Leptothoe sp. PORK10 BA2]MEA5464308.1 caspase family protein [Leptothoe sp. PORK10 BA2]
MSTCWAIIIGINQYQGFQPLMQAQNDAVGIRRYLIDDAGFAPENCILLSDLSTSTEQEAVYPDRVAINDWLETICQGRVQSDDTLWFYFSGYGAQADNKDYLMPVDGDPAQVKQTGIALQDVVKHLQQSPTKNTMLVLDMNRSQSALAGQAIGEQVTKLAKKARIPLILSCQPNEFSHETLAVRHGLFTAALLEGLRYDGCATLSHLERYLVERVPELCEHHWRPIQNPVVAIPEEQKFRLLWHQRDTAAPEVAAADMTAPLIPDNPDTAVYLSETDYSSETGYGADTDYIPETAPLIPENPDADFGNGAELIPESGPELTLEDELPEEPQREPFSLDPVEADNTADDAEVYGTTLTDDLSEAKPAKGNIGGCLGLLGALGALLLLGAVLFRDQPMVKSTLARVPPEWLARVGLDADGGADSDVTTPDNPADGNPTADTGLPEGAEPSETPDTSGEENAAGDNSAESTGDTAAGTDATPENPDGDTADAEVDVDLDDIGLGVDGADGATGDSPGTSNPAGANGAASGVTAAGNTTPGSGGTDTAALLAEARRSLRPSQASRFASAIATARQIPPGDPNYAQAQADIQRWSQVILDLAEGRAAESELEAAINAAKLIPKEPANIYQTAQERIGLWQTRAQARTLIREAQAMPRLGQASTYQKGILKLQEVPKDLPIEYGDAQRLIGEWTEKMLTIAQARAAQGRYASAIEAASLIPKNTPNYQAAQTEITRWRGE